MATGFVLLSAPSSLLSYGRRWLRNGGSFSAVLAPGPGRLDGTWRYADCAAAKLRSVLGASALQPQSGSIESTGMATSCIR